jgi:hypothetical protein
MQIDMTDTRWFTLLVAQYSRLLSLKVVVEAIIWLIVRAVEKSFFVGQKIVQSLFIEQLEIKSGVG